MLEIFTALCGLIQSILIMFKRKENWVFYLMNIGALTIYSFYVHLYGDVAENLIYVVFGLLGLCTWYSQGIAKKILGNNTEIKYCNAKERIFYLVMFVGISVGVYFWLLHTNDPAPFLDAITTGMGFTATLSMAFKRVESWIIWFVDDFLMAYIYFTLPDTGFWLMLLNIVWVFLAVGTWYTWHKEAMKNKKKNKESVNVIGQV